MLSLSSSKWITLILSLLAFGTVVLYLSSTTSILKVDCLSCAAVLLATPVAHTAVNASPQALNTTNTNLLPNPAGRTIYYNGSGDTPSYHATSPDPVPITPINSSSSLLDAFYSEIVGIASSSAFGNNCSQCIAGAEVLHFAALTQSVSSFTQLLIKICNAVPAVKSSINSVSCEAQYGSTPNGILPYSNGAAGIGAYYAQLFSKMSINTNDFATYCHNVWSVCSEPPLIGIEESMYFTPKSASADAALPPSGKNLNVLHLSDYHIDPRYDIGSEANCTSHLCCRPDAVNNVLHTNAQSPGLPASRFGALKCDSPPDLALSAFQSMPQFFDVSNISFSIYTGDIVSHDRDDQLSQAYIEYEETIAYDTFKAALNNAPVYATLGNHDSFPQALNAPNSLAPKNAFSWNYELLASLWQNASWLNASEAQYAATHYGAFAVTTPQGLRVISLNTDFWYKANIFNYYNTTNPDQSGILSFLAAELLACEARNQRAWIIGHVLSGYDGSNPLPNPTALFYSIVARFATKTIALVAFGHTHEDQKQIYYDFLPNSTYTIDGRTYRNTTMVDYTKPIAIAYIGPSVVPLTNLNAGYTMYQVDDFTFEIMGSQVYFANISNSLTWTTPEWEFEYDARTAYTPVISGGWPATAPLNATFWHKVTEAMLENTSVAQMYSTYETKSSVVTPACDTAECARRKVCYIRSGSAALGRACPRVPSS